jgi:predicted ArsR family transcriptional regulator
MATVPGRPAGGDEVSPTGLTILDTLAMPEDERRLMTWLTRQRAADLAGVADVLEVTEDVARTRLDALIARGIVEQVATMDGPRYRPRMATRPNRRVSADIWKALD